jgi:hypothetical protein
MAVGSADGAVVVVAGTHAAMVSTMPAIKTERM